MFLKIIFVYFLLMCKVLNTTSCFCNFATTLIYHWKVIIILHLLYLSSLQLLHGDTKLNLGPRNGKNNLPSFCYWKLNSLPIDKFAKMFLIKAYNATYESDFICMSEVYLNSSISSDHVSLDLEGYNLARADHPDNVKSG